MSSLFYGSSACLACKCSCSLAALISQIPGYCYFPLEGDTEHFWGTKAQHRIPYSRPYGFQLSVPLFWLG